MVSNSVFKPNPKGANDWHNDGYIPKHDLTAENHIIGICIYFGTEFFVKAKQYITTPEIFYNSDNQTIWKAMDAMYENGTPIEITLLTRELIKSPSQTLDNWGYIIAKKVDMNTTTVYMTHWCLAIVEDYVERLSKAAVYEAGNGDAFTIAKELDAKIKKAMDFTVVDDWADMSQLALQLNDRRTKIEQGYNFGIMTGFKELDVLTGGIEPGMVVVAARPSMGKTAFACSLVINMAQLGSPVGIISLEMPNIQLAGRFAAIVSDTEFWRVYRNKPIDQQQQDHVNNSLANMATLPVFATDTAKVNLSDIRWKCEKLSRAKGAKCIVIDYIQLVTPEHEKAQTREREVAKLSAGLKAISKDLNIVIVALAQLNRESETPDKVSRMGKLSQLRESDAILADADMGIIVDRPFKRGETTDDKGETTENIGRINVEKFRNGETKLIELQFNPQTMRFSDKQTEYPQMEQFKPIKRDYNELPIADVPF